MQFAPTSTGPAGATLTANGNKTAATATDSLLGTGASAGHIYWANRFTGTIDEAPLGGGTATTLVSGQSGPFGVAVDASHIYWAKGDGSTIDEANLDGTNPQTIATGQSEPFGVAVGP